MTPRQALAFVKRHGLVLESAQGPVPNLAEAIAGERIRGSWWGHAKGRAIFRLTRQVRASPDVLVCRLVDNKVTYLHRRLWPALLRLADELPPSRINVLREVHTPTGKHRTDEIPISRWMSDEVQETSKSLSREDAVAAFPCDLIHNLHYSDR